ncbi:hypothetical protein DH2020_004606 [Rehmannia glutinosa]|uniref:RRM domain-containing protein n=1 Tax=Rehmannia glutinosa TaxID=99300 RepID=A0ABR0XQA0_REHGL
MIDIVLEDIRQFVLYDSAMYKLQVRVVDHIENAVFLVWDKDCITLIDKIAFELKSTVKEEIDINGFRSGKLFIGGISWETDEEKLKEYFQGYGEVLQAVVMRDKITGKPRGFGFVVFADPDVLDRVLQDRHVIDGRTVEAKRALSREEQQVSKVGNSGGARNFGGGGGTRTKKIFVGVCPQL